MILVRLYYLYGAYRPIQIYSPQKLILLGLSRFINKILIYDISQSFYWYIWIILNFIPVSVYLHPLFHGRVIVYGISLSIYTHYFMDM